MSVFVDTSAWFAYWNRDDVRHARAVAIMNRLGATREPLVTNDLVFAETLGLLHRRLGPQAARKVSEELAGNPCLEIRCLSAAQVAHACRRFAGGAEQASFVDCASFVTMESENIRSAFTFDEDFSRAGFRREQ